MEALASNYVPLFYVYSAHYGEGRTTVPVLRSQALYANFSHVVGRGRPGRDGGLQRRQSPHPRRSHRTARKHEVRAPRCRGSREGSKPFRVDALIQQYGAKLHALATAPALPYAPSASTSLAEPGMLFSMAA